jgi:hypothetical protein
LLLATGVAPAQERRLAHVVFGSAFLPAASGRGHDVPRLVLPEIAEGSMLAQERLQTPQRSRERFSLTDHDTNAHPTASLRLTQGRDPESAQRRRPSVQRLGWRYQV